jgi:hypothetical protein
MGDRELVPPNPWRLFAVAVAVILAFAVLFPFAGGFVDTTGDTSITYTVSDAFDAPASFVATVLAKSFHLSVLTFTLVGAEGLAPVGVTRFLVDLEALLGMGFLALLVASLIRDA